MTRHTRETFRLRLESQSPCYNCTPLVYKRITSLARGRDSLCCWNEEGF